MKSLFFQTTILFATTLAALSIVAPSAHAQSDFERAGLHVIQLKQQLDAALAAVKQLVK